MAAPLDDESPFPPESELVARLGISRGTLRRATEELVRQGLLRIEPGRGTFVEGAERVRRTVWSELVEVARPDSRFDLDLRRYIPDFAGRERCDDRLFSLDGYGRSRTIFVAPDNSLEHFRAAALRDGKRILVPTYGLARGFVLLDGATIAGSQTDLAATLDAMERFGQRLDLRGLRAVGRIELVVTGAVAVTAGGGHVDAGHGYLAAEWRLLAELGLVEPGVTEVVASVHACQVIDTDLCPAPALALVDVIVTPRRLLRCRHEHVRLGGLGVDDPYGEVDGIAAYLGELAEERRRANTWAGGDVRPPGSASHSGRRSRPGRAAVPRAAP